MRDLIVRHPASWRPPLVALLALGLAGCAPTASEPPATGAEAGPTAAAVDHPAEAKGASVIGTCATTSAGTVVCTLPDSGNTIDLATLLTQAQAVDSSITTATEMVLTAVGGSGATAGYDLAGKGGAGGVAQTVTTIANYKSGYGTTALYYYLGSNGSTGNDGAATGGASTIVASVDLNAKAACIAGYGSCTASNVVLVAGGGGGGGIGQAQCHGGTGGAGGTANATSTSDVTDAGEHGTQSCAESGNPGEGGDAGKGGDGGDGGNGSYSKAGTSGGDGIGGVGGPHHTSNGPSAVTTWKNGASDGTDGIMSNVGSTNGAGGEGEFRKDSAQSYGCGGGGGGGFGGGGGGGGGGLDMQGGGGGGGGSYAAGVTVLTSTISTPSSEGNAEVMITFHP